MWSDRIGNTGWLKSNTWIWAVVDAEDHRAVGRMEVQADDVAVLLNEQRILGKGRRCG
jgi:hypothetical protein